MRRKQIDGRIFLAISEKRLEYKWCPIDTSRHPALGNVFAGQFCILLSGSAQSDWEKISMSGIVIYSHSINEAVHIGIKQFPIECLFLNFGELPIFFNIFRFVQNLRH